MFDSTQLPVPDLGFRCKTCGYPLARLTEHKCPECGKPFALEDYIPSGRVPMLIAGGEQAIATPDVIELLDRYGIPHVEQTGYMSSLFGNLRLFQTGRAGPICVPRDRYLEAIDLIRRQRFDEPMPQPSAPPSEQPWTCPHCHERNPPRFEVCWHCGKPMPDSDQTQG